MKIREIVLEAQLDEGPMLNRIGTGIGKAAGAAGKAVGAVAGGVAGLGRAIRKGYQAGKQTVGGAGDEPGTGAAPAGGGGVGAGVLQGIRGTDADAPTASGSTPPTASDINAQGPKGTVQAKTQTGAAGAALAKTDTAVQDLGQQKQKNDAIYATVKSQVDQLDNAGKKQLLTLIQKSIQQGGNEKPAAGPGSPTAGTTAAGQPKVEPDLNAPAAAGTAPAGDAATTGTPAAGSTAPAKKPAAPANKAASDTFEKAKGDMRKVAGGSKPLPDQMAQGVQSDIAKMAKGDKESGVAAAQKIMGLAQRGMDVAALQQAWNANSKAGERFLKQDVYRAITNMLREHGLIWSDLGLKVRIDESVSQGVFIRHVRPVVENAQLFRIR